MEIPLSFIHVELEDHHKEVFLITIMLTTRMKQKYWVHENPLLAPQYLNIDLLTIYFFKFAIAAAFVAHLVIDIEHQILPDKMNWFLLAIILPFAVINYPLFIFQKH